MLILITNDKLVKLKLFYVNLLKVYIEGQWFLAYGKVPVAPLITGVGGGCQASPLSQAHSKAPLFMNT